MAYTILSGRTKAELLDKLNGMLTGTVNLVDGANVNGLTLIFTVPAGTTVTFTDPDTVSLEDIVAEINAASGLAGVASIRTLKVGTPLDGKTPQLDRRLVLSDPAAAGVTLDTGTSTGNALLGFGTANEVGIVIPFTRIEGGISQDGSNHYFVLVAP